MGEEAAVARPACCLPGVVRGEWKHLRSAAAAVGCRGRAKGADGLEMSRCVLPLGTGCMGLVFVKAMRREEP